jgi:hypothetical protein
VCIKTIKEKGILVGSFFWHQNLDEEELQRVHQLAVQGERVRFVRLSVEDQAVEENMEPGCLALKRGLENATMLPIAHLLICLLEVWHPRTCMVKKPA